MHEDLPRRVPRRYGGHVITLAHFDPDVDAEALVDFMTKNDFTFHAGRTPTREQVLTRLAGAGWGRAYWLVDDQLGRIGIARLEDLDEEVSADETPMFDLRLAEEFRGRGFGQQALQALTSHVFNTLPVRRFEGCTRVDNLPMRHTFLACGWVKEAHYREAWPVPGRDPVDAVNYSILRRDWANGTTTPVCFDDLEEHRPGRRIAERILTIIQCRVYRSDAIARSITWRLLAGRAGGRLRPLS